MDEESFEKAHSLHNKIYDLTKLTTQIKASDKKDYDIQIQVFNYDISSFPSASFKLEGDLKNKILSILTEELEALNKKFDAM